MIWTFQGFGLFGECTQGDSGDGPEILAEAIEMFLTNLDYAKLEGIL